MKELSAVALIALATVSLSLLYIRAKHCLDSGLVYRIYIELFVPFLLILIYGFLPIGLLFLDGESRRAFVGVSFENQDLFFSALVMIYAGFFFWIGALITYKSDIGRIGRISSLSLTEYLRPRFVRVVVVLGIVDLAVRLQKITSGAYFTWMKKHSIASIEVTENPIWMLQDNLTCLLVALAFGLSLKNRVWLFYIALLLFMSILGGSRLSLFFSITALVFSILQYGFYKMRLIRLLKTVAIVIPLFLVASNIILSARIALREDISYAVENPVSFTTDLITVHAPNALNPFGEARPAASTLEKAGPLFRGYSWSASLASQINALRYGRSLIDFEYFVLEFSRAIPSILWPGKKPTHNSGALVSNHFGLRGSDPPSNIFQSMFLFTSVQGVIIFAFVVGVIYAVFCRILLVTLSGWGVLVLFGSVGFLDIFANTYSAIFTGARNFTLVCIVLWLMVLPGIRLFKRKSTPYRA